jgi:F0F1-type ATP synthase assembly protein I
MNGKDGNVWIQVARYLSMATLLPAATVAGYGVGYGLDHLFGTRFLRIVFLVFGIAGGFLNLIRELNRDR